jgi:hypothetical protein
MVTALVDAAGLIPNHTSTAPDVARTEVPAKDQVIPEADTAVAACPDDTPWFTTTATRTSLVAEAVTVGVMDAVDVMFVVTLFPVISVGWMGMEPTSITA